MVESLADNNVALIETTSAQMLELVQTFANNTFGYFLVFMPLFLLYKIYKRMYQNTSRVQGNGPVYQFLNLYAFGTGNWRNQTTPDRVNLLPMTRSDMNNNQENQSTNKGDSPSSNTSDANRTGRRKILKLIVCFCGLQISFLIWGLMQERIVKYGYSATHTDNQKEQFSQFKNSQFLVLTNRLAGFILAFAILFVFNSYKYRIGRISTVKITLFNSFENMTSLNSLAPLFICSYSSLSNVLSSWFQYESLKYVSFTTQLLAKSSKSIFVMLTGKLVSNKTYRPVEYVCVFLIGIGIFLFSDIGENNLNKTTQVLKTTLPGFVCLLGYLVTDSFTSTWQDNVIKTYTMSSISLMLVTNFYSCVYTFVSLVFENELFASIAFMYNHSDIITHIVLLSIASAIGQIFIFVTIQQFGALVFSLIMTTRQILSIVLSSVVFQHTLSLSNCFGIFIIFFALFLQQFSKFSTKKTSPPGRVLLS